MPRPHRQPHEAQAAQQGADRPLGQRHVEALRDHRGEIGPSPAHHAVHGRVGAGPNQLGDDRRLLGRQARPRTDRAGPTAPTGPRRCSDAPSHAASAGPCRTRAVSVRDAPSSTSASASIRRAASASRPVAAARRKSAASWSLRVIVIAAMCPKPPLPKASNQMRRDQGIPLRKSAIVSGGIYARRDCLTLDEFPERR